MQFCLEKNEETNMGNGILQLAVSRKALLELEYRSLDSSFQTQENSTRATGAWHLPDDLKQTIDGVER
jgi:hypothetical protein